MSQPGRQPANTFFVRLDSETDFAGWRDAARRLVLNQIEPHDIVWGMATDDDLFAAAAVLPDIPPSRTLNVQREFVERAEAVICHSEPSRFALLYRILFRLTREPELLKIASDPDIIRFYELDKSVRRDIHKMRAFVRFVEIGEAEAVSYTHLTLPTILRV